MDSIRVDGTDSQTARVLTAAVGAYAAVDNLRALTGGASRTTWAFDAVTGEHAGR